MKKNIKPWHIIKMNHYLDGGTWEFETGDGKFYHFDFKWDDNLKSTGDLYVGKVKDVDKRIAIKEEMNMVHDLLCRALLRAMNKLKKHES